MVREEHALLGRNTARPGHASLRERIASQSDVARRTLDATRNRGCSTCTTAYPLTSFSNQRRASLHTVLMQSGAHHVVIVAHSPFVPARRGRLAGCRRYRAGVRVA